MKQYENVANINFSERSSGGSGADTFVIGNANGNFYQDAAYATITDYNSIIEDTTNIALTSSHFDFV